MSFIYLWRNHIDCDLERNREINEMQKYHRLTRPWLLKGVVFMFLPKLWFEASTWLKFHVVSPLQVFLIISRRACWSLKTGMYILVIGFLALRNSFPVDSGVQGSIAQQLQAQVPNSDSLALNSSFLTYSYMALHKLLNLCICFLIYKAEIILPPYLLVITTSL